MSVGLGLVSDNVTIILIKILQLPQILWNINHILVVHIPGNWPTEKSKCSKEYRLIIKLLDNPES